MNELINCKNIAMKFKLICLIAILYNPTLRMVYPPFLWWIASHTLPGLQR